MNTAAQGAMVREDQEVKEPLIAHEDSNLEASREQADLAGGSAGRMCYQHEGTALPSFQDFCGHVTKFR